MQVNSLLLNRHLTLVSRILINILKFICVLRIIFLILFLKTKQPTIIMDFKRMAAAAIAALNIISVVAQTSDSVASDSSEENLIAFNLEARLDVQYVEDEGKTRQSQTGFMGKYIALKAQGTLAKGLSYTWRQRFSRTPKDHTFWDQTDILELAYQTGKFDVGAGKQVVMIGGYEYNRPPIDLMCPNLFVANVACYQFGVSGGYQVSAHDHIGLQISQSLFATSADRNLYAFNLMWSSSRKLSNRFQFETLWSVNEIEYNKGKFCNYVALGNKLVFDNKLTLLADIMIRTYPGNNPFKNNTFMGELGWDPTPYLHLAGKLSYDCNLGVNLTKNTEVARGTQLAMAGVVGEWFPIKKHHDLLRLHAALFYSYGRNKNPNDLMQRKTFYASVGMTWHMNLIKLKRSVLK